jgi:hypothetical protein
MTTYRIVWLIMRGYDRGTAETFVADVTLKRNVSLTLKEWQSFYDLRKEWIRCTTIVTFFENVLCYVLKSMF